MAAGSLSGDLGERDLIDFRGNSIEVDINDLRPTDRILEVLGCDVSMRLHFGENEIDRIAI